jgi:propanol-preferring alcohol dehydrogenase
LAIQYARAKGLLVLAIDTGKDKKDLCNRLGADSWIDFRESKDIVDDVKKVTNGGAHAAIITSTSSAAYDLAVDYLRPGGTLMAVGLPGTAKLESSIFFTVFKAITIKGSYVGNRQDADEAIAIAASGKIKVHYAQKPLKDLKS